MPDHQRTGSPTVHDARAARIVTVRAALVLQSRQPQDGAQQRQHYRQEEHIYDREGRLMEQLHSHALLRLVACRDQQPWQPNYRGDYEPEAHGRRHVNHAVAHPQGDVARSHAWPRWEVSPDALAGEGPRCASHPYRNEGYGQDRAPHGRGAEVLLRQPHTCQRHRCGSSRRRDDRTQPERPEHRVQQRLP